MDGTIGMLVWMIIVLILGFNFVIKYLREILEELRKRQ